MTKHVIPIEKMFMLRSIYPALVLVLMLLVAVLVGCGSTPTTATSNPSATATKAPTQPQKTPTLQSTIGDTVLGQPLSHFVARYGQPNDHTDAKSGSYHFQRYGGSNVDSLILWTDIFDGSTYSQQVENVDAQAPSGGWNSTDAKAICGSFLPSDADYKSEVQLTTSNAYDKIYYSASLASLFPASSFVDASQNPVQAGLFDVQYLAESVSNPSIASCSLQIGTQQTQ